LLTNEKNDTLKGYKGKTLRLLTENDIVVGDIIQLNTVDNEFRGMLMPRYESADEDHIVIKLKSGYNAGIESTKIQSIKKVAEISDQNTPPASNRALFTDTCKVQVNSYINNDNEETLPKIALISTGGTIASKIDYRTGAVRAALSASDLYISIPELLKYTIIDSEILLNEYSENLKPEHWTLIANKVAEKVRSGKYQGVIVSHGTDTMHYTASALSFALQNLPIPVILVGAQRSSDRPSSDAALNLIGAAVFAIKSDYSGVFVAMHASSSDDVIACHVGTRVRKNHTSRRDAFESINTSPIALVKDDNVQMQLQENTALQRRDNNNCNKFVTMSNYDSRVLLLKFHPGFDPDFISHALLMDKYKAIVIEGTGLGHISRECIPKLKKAIESGIMVFMTSQCIWGRTGMTVYNTGRDLLNLGVIPLSDMIPETALVKTMWVLANSKSFGEARKMMQENVSNEMSTVLPIMEKGIIGKNEILHFSCD
jgi:glutamyl-tRNA(Gln) amidotransferase subunit D